jgi:hypothetical protein
VKRSRSARRNVVWRVAVCLAALAAIGQTTVFSGASFTSNRSSNPGNLVRAGTLHVTNTKDAQVVVNAASIRPGQTVTGTAFTLTNDGTVQGSYQIARLTLTDVPATPALSGALTMTITNVTAGTTVWTGVMNTFSSVSLGTFTVGQSRNYSVAVTFPSGSATPTLQGAATTLVLRFSGTSL